MSERPRPSGGRPVALFPDRAEAGRRLGAALAVMAGHRGASALPGDLVVLGLPRGGVPVAVEVARALAAPVDVAVVRKLGVPSRPELAMGAVGEGGARVVDVGILRAARVRPEDLAEVERRETRVVRDRARDLRGDRPPADLRGRTVVIVDDGVATGATMLVACRAVRAREARRVVVAAPVGAAEALRLLRDGADEVFCLVTPRPFRSVSRWYGDFTQVGTDEVVRLLARAAPRRP